MKKPIVYFDGVCGLCNGFIDFVISLDKKNHFLFSPLQSEYAKTHLPEEYTLDLKSVVLQIDGNTYSKSRAVLKVLDLIGGPWKLSIVFQLIPQGIADKIYDLVATNRYKLFGKKETCRLPTPEERMRFIL